MVTPVRHSPKPYHEKPTSTQYSPTSNIAPILKQVTSPMLNPMPVLNTDFKRYEILRDRILDKIFEVILILEDPASSLNKSLKNIMHKNVHDDRNQIQSLTFAINTNADYLLGNDKTDSYEFFKNMNNFIINIKNMQKKLEYYILKTDSIDNFNIQEALETLNRLIDDFKILEKSEEKFPKEFRQQYVKKFEEKNFF